MNWLVQSGVNPWSEEVLTHAQWNLVYVALGLVVLFMIGHTLFVMFWPKPAGPPHAPAMAAAPANLPARVKRHSLAARLFHWIMAASMLTLLVTSFAPILGWQFDWVQIHWIAGIALTISIVYHIIHASFWLDFWSIWLNREDVAEAATRFRRAMGGRAPAPRKAAKYPWDNKMYHTAIVLSALAVVPTGLFMMVRVRTPFWERNPYLLADSTWGWMYVLHGLSGIGLVGLTLAHIYFAIRPEKIWITKGMVFGDISRQDYLEHHDPQRWVVEGLDPAAGLAAPFSEAHTTRMRGELKDRCARIEECYEFMLAYAAQGLRTEPGGGSGSQVRTLLTLCDKALTGLAELFTQIARTDALEPAEAYEHFIAVLGRDASDAQAAIRLVLAQPSISSQLIDNLNASIHLRALLTDLFLIDEIVRPDAAGTPAASTE